MFAFQKHNSSFQDIPGASYILCGETFYQICCTETGASISLKNFTCHGHCYRVCRLQCTTFHTFFMYQMNSVLASPNSVHVHCSLAYITLRYWLLLVFVGIKQRLFEFSFTDIIYKKEFEKRYINILLILPQCCFHLLNSIYGP